MSKGEAISKLFDGGPTVDPLIGTIVDERFEILEFKGEGASSRVYRAKQKGLDREVAIKIFKSGLDQDTLEKFQREALAVSRLSHQSVIGLYAFGLTQDQPYMVLEYIRGTTLSDYIAKKRRLSAWETLEIIKHILEGLEHIHANGILHRDLKPSNVIVESGADGELNAKIVDFGIAKVATTALEASLTPDSRSVGTPFYMSPEHCKGESVDAKSDIYSIGCMMYEMIAGEPPLVGKTPYETLLLHVHHKAIPFSERKEDLVVPKELEAVVMKALSKDPAERFASAREFHSAINDIDESKIVAPGERAALFVRRRLRPLLHIKAFVRSIYFLAIAIPAVLIFGWFANQPQAAPYCEKVLEWQTSVLGDDNGLSVPLVYHLGNLYERLGRYDRSALLMERAVRIQTKLSGSTSSATVAAAIERGKIAAIHPEYYGATKTFKIAVDQLDIATELKKISGTESEVKALATSNADISKRIPDMVKQAPSLLPKSIDLLQEEITRLYKLGEHQSAVDCLSSLIALRPFIDIESCEKYINALAFVSGTARENHDNVTAARCIGTTGETIAALPEYRQVELYTYLGELFCKQSTPMPVRAMLIEPLSEAPKKYSVPLPVHAAFYMYNLTVWLYEQKEFQAADLAIKQINAINETWVCEGCIRLGLAAVKAHDNERAEKYLQMADEYINKMKAYPSGALPRVRELELRAHLAELMIELKHFDAAKAALAEATDPNTGIQKGRKRKAMAQYLLGRLHYEQGEYDLAAKRFEKALSIHTNRPMRTRPEILNWYGKTLVKLGDTAKAAEVRKEANETAKQLDVQTPEEE